MDLSKLSSNDLRYISEGKLNLVSNAGLQVLSAEPSAPSAKTDWAVSEMSGPQRFLAGAGKAFVDLGRGAAQMAGMADQADIDEAKRLDQALVNDNAGMAGNLTGNIAAMIPAAMIPGASTLTGSALIGGASSALQPTATGDSRLGNVAVGAGLGLAGQGVANVIGRLAKPVRSTLAPQAAKLASQADDIGINLNAAQRTGSKPLKWIDSALDNLPFTAEKQAAQKMAQREAWQRAVLKHVGENADAAGTDVMGAAKERLGQAFQDLSSRNVVQLDDSLKSAVQKVRLENAKAGPLASSKVDDVAKWVEEMATAKPPRVVPTGVLDAAGNPVTTVIPGVSPKPIEGRVYQDVRSILSRNSKDAFKSGNSQLGQALKELRNALDDAAERSISDADLSAWKLVRQQYGTLKSLEKTVDPNTGMISPKKLINELSRSNKNAMIYGQGDQTLPDLARLGKEFIAETLPDSGTAQRAWYMNMLQSPTSHLGGLLGFLGGGPPGALIGAAAGAGTPLAVQRAMWSGPGLRYLTEGIKPATAALPYVNIGAQAIPLGLLNSQQ